MKIILATDGSQCSQYTLQMLANQQWPAGTEVKVVSVIHALPFVYDPMLIGVGLHYISLENEKKRASESVKSAAAALSAAAPHLSVTQLTPEGSPAACIVEEASRWGADLILMGAHGHHTPGRFVIGSVAHGVILHAPCSVQIGRDPATTPQKPRSPLQG